MEEIDNIIQTTLGLIFCGVLFWGIKVFNDIEKRFYSDEKKHQ